MLLNRRAQPPGEQEYFGAYDMSFMETDSLRPINTVVDSLGHQLRDVPVVDDITTLRLTATWTDGTSRPVQRESPHRTRDSPLSVPPSRRMAEDLALADNHQAGPPPPPPQGATTSLLATLDEIEAEARLPVWGDEEESEYISIAQAARDRAARYARENARERQNRGRRRNTSADDEHRLHCLLCQFRGRKQDVGENGSRLYADLMKMVADDLAEPRAKTVAMIHAFYEDQVYPKLVRIGGANWAPPQGFFEDETERHLSSMEYSLQSELFVANELRDMEIEKNLARERLIHRGTGVFDYRLWAEIGKNRDRQLRFHCSNIRKMAFSATPASDFRPFAADRPDEGQGGGAGSNEEPDLMASSAQWLRVYRQRERGGGGADQRSPPSLALTPTVDDVDGDLGGLAIPAVSGAEGMQASLSARGGAA